MGGGWRDPVYQYREHDAAPPVERREGSGFRLIRQDKPWDSALARPIEKRPIQPSQPVDDATFALLASQYEYDALPLEVRVEEVDDSHAAWRRERVSFTAGYGGERMTAILFIPKHVRPPYQVVVYYAASDALVMPSSRRLWLRYVDFYIRSGRVVMYPVLKGMYERKVPPSQGINDRRDRRIQRAKDVRRSVDYLVTRPDIDSQRIAYYGFSLGASNSPFVLATEPRFRCAVLLAGGLGAIDWPAEAKQENFLPRVRQPVLLLAGRYDFTFPAEDSQRLFFEMLGTPADRKKHVIYDGGHIPSQFNDAVREMLAWTDRWMGEVR